MKKIITAISLLFLLGACNELPVKIRASIVADKTVNPNVARRASPVELRIYHLRNAQRFNKAGYFSLLNYDTKVLGSDLLRKEAMIVRPGQKIPYKTDAHKQTKYLAVFAAFRVHSRPYWKAIKRTSAFKMEYTTIVLSRNQVLFQDP